MFRNGTQKDWKYFDLYCYCLFGNDTWIYNHKILKNYESPKIWRFV